MTLYKQILNLGLKKDLKSQNFSNLKSKIHNFNLKNNQYSKFNFCIKRKTRKYVIEKYLTLNKILFCNSKNDLIKIINSLNLKWKKLIRNYISGFFLYHLHIRQVKDVPLLMKNRECFYKSITTPEILKKNTKLTNNIIKNFCKGFVNYILIFFQSLLKSNLLPKE